MAVNLLTIDDQAVNAMIADHRIVALLPCLSATKTSIDGIAPGKPGCTICEGKRASMRTQLYNDAKMCIARLRGDNLVKLKELLNTRQLRLYVNRTTYTL